MKKYLNVIWEMKYWLITIWIFFFLLSLVSNSPYNAFMLFLISGAWTFGLLILGIVLFKLKLL